LGISKYLPNRNKIIPVYGLIVLFIYGWTIYWYLWNLPSWLTFIPASDIIGVLAYALVNNFLESLSMLGLLIILGILLPENLFRGDFVFRAGLTVIVVLSLTMYLLNNFVPLKELGKACAIGAALLLTMQFIASRHRLIKSAIESVADRTVIFLYLSIPLSLTGLLVILVRNL
jgi:hypothetical protein